LERYSNIKAGEKGAWISIGAYVCLSAIKLYVGWQTGAQALWADGLNNATDIIASIAVLIGLRISQKPPDLNHRYGHFRAETVAALVASLIMFAVGVQVISQAVRLWISGNFVAPDLTAAWVSGVCAGVMFLVFRYNLRLANRIHNQALRAAAMDNRSDALVSTGACIGILGAGLGITWLDPLAAVIVGCIICLTAWNIFRETTHSLTDGFDIEHLDRFKQTVRATPGVHSVKDIRARAHGNFILVDVTIGVDQELNVTESHAISDEIERRLYEEHRLDHVHIHVEPT
jgi:cation diffusion facilitator family transporter